MDSIILPTEFEHSRLSYSEPRKLDNGGKTLYISYDKHPLVLQLPQMSVPFGLNKWNNDGKIPDKYSLDVSFKGKEQREILMKLFNVLQQFDKKLVKDALDHSQSWFSKKYSTIEVVEALYTPMVKFGKDKNTGEITEAYPPTFKMNIPFRDGRFGCEVYDSTQKQIDLSSVDLKGGRVSAIVQCTGIWIAGSKFGTSWKVVQMQVFPKSVISGFAFKPIKDNLPVEEDLEVDSVDDAPVETLVDKDDEDDDSDEIVESDDDLETPPPPPPPVKTTKRVVTKQK